MKLRLIGLLTLLSTSIWGKLPTGSYYSQLETQISSGQDLKESLHQIIKDHKSFSYKQARRYLFGHLHLEKESGAYFVQDVYCEQKISSEFGVGPNQIPDYKVINCEHTWPQSRFNNSMSINAQKTDLHHLFPTDSRANSSRSNILFGEVRGRDVHENCSSSQRGQDVISRGTSFEPPPTHRGNVARALFYFSVRYKTPISQDEETHLRKWHLDDPVDQDESDRNENIYELQGNRNPFIDEPSAVDDIEDF